MIFRMKKVDRKINIAELIEKYPETAEVLFASGFYCLGCSMAGFETLEDGALAHGMSDKEIDKLVQKLNKRILKEKTTAGVKKRLSKD